MTALWVAVVVLALAVAAITAWLIWEIRGAQDHAAYASDGLDQLTLRLDLYAASLGLDSHYQTIPDGHVERQVTDGGPTLWFRDNTTETPTEEMEQL